jgi:hypothetical protein
MLVVSFNWNRTLVELSKCISINELDTRRNRHRLKCGKYIYTGFNSCQSRARFKWHSWKRFTKWETRCFKNSNISRNENHLKWTKKNTVDLIRPNNGKMPESSHFQEWQLIKVMMTKMPKRWFASIMSILKWKNQCVLQPPKLNGPRVERPGTLNNCQLWTITNSCLMQIINQLWQNTRRFVQTHFNQWIGHSLES